MQIDLLRHGETTLSHTLRGHLDDDLTEQGWLQMQSTIQQYMTTPVDWDVIISSPLRRCRRFAEHLADQLGLPMRVNEHIKEMYFGDWEGISTQAIYEAEPERLANFWQFPTQYHAPNGESLIQFQQRVMYGFEEIYVQMQQRNWNKALVVTHGGVIKLLTCLARQQNLDDLLK
ncbi:MAG: histidine phosphatase family protein, partial [Moraxellaceae bacterium]|nr:histidine phosphatase family protein [Moraxellaceae bacterium]